MKMLLVFLIGFLIGWLLEFIIDWLWWGNRRVSSAGIGKGATVPSPGGKQAGGKRAKAATPGKAKSGFGGDPGKRDDLTVIWGIGPKIRYILNKEGVYLFTELAEMSHDRLSEILDAAGPRFRLSSDNLHKTWPEQARLAARGDMEALKKIKEELDWKTVQ